MAWAQKVCAILSSTGHWCDYIDPCSGLAMVHKDSNQVRLVESSSGGVWGEG